MTSGRTGRSGGRSASAEYAQDEADSFLCNFHLPLPPLLLSSSRSFSFPLHLKNIALTFFSDSLFFSDEFACCLIPERRKLEAKRKEQSCADAETISTAETNRLVFLLTTTMETPHCHGSDDPSGIDSLCPDDDLQRVPLSLLAPDPLDTAPLLNLVSDALSSLEQIRRWRDDWQRSALERLALFDDGFVASPSSVR